jgi:hypothetical protein
VNASLFCSTVASRTLSSRREGRVGFEKDPGVLLFDHLVVLSGLGNNAEPEVRFRPSLLGDQTQAARFRSLLRGRDELPHGLNRVVGEC